jgi:hypothetical protein
MRYFPDVWVLMGDLANSDIGDDLWDDYPELDKKSIEIMEVELFLDLTGNLDADV